MSREPWPGDAVTRKAWIAALVHDVDHRSRSGRHELLIDLLRTA
jgi:hypothetical protein